MRRVGLIPGKEEQVKKPTLVKVIGKIVPGKTAPGKTAPGYPDLAVGPADVGTVTIKK